MAQIIPNEESWIGFVPAGAHPFGLADIDAPTAAEIAAAIDVTDFIVSITASTAGNTVPVPRLKRRFEPNISGTAAGQFSADVYRDDTDDTAWDTLPRGVKGSFLIKRFGGTGAALAPAVGESVEVWPVSVTSRAGNQLQSNTAQMATVTCAVPEEPNEDAIVAA